MMDRRTFHRALSALIAAPFAGCNSHRTIELYVETEADFPLFDPESLTCSWGDLIRLTFHHAGKIITQTHNWVLVKPHSEEAVVTAGIEAGEENGWLRPNDPRVIAATPLIGKGETVTIEFAAPPPGDYPYICTTPGHAEDMHGILHVTRA
ncbi:MAG: hypothetical protein KDE14_12725 [Rhodobacteraceae bacterium]|nr:hypothetical protein [Paracoccaceae bacterium]